MSDTADWTGYYGRRPVLFVDGPLRGEVREVKGWHYVTAVRHPSVDRYDFHQVAYHVQRGVMFDREIHLAAVACELDSDDVLRLILTEAAQSALLAKRGTMAG